MPIEFRCPSCNQQLRVPDTAAGKNAKCPKCATVVSVPAASAGAFPPPAPPAPQPPGGFGAPAPAKSPFDFGQPSTPPKPQQPAFGFGQPATPPSTPQTPPFNFGQPTSPPGGAFGAPPGGAFGAPAPGGGFGAPALNPFADAGQASGGGFGAGPVNPYASPAAIMERPKIGLGSGIQPTVVDVGPIMSWSFKVWQDNLGILIGVFVVYIILLVVVAWGKEVAKFAIMFGGVPALSILGGLALELAGVAWQTFLTNGMIIFGLKLARQQRAEFTDLFAGGETFLRVFGFQIVMFVAWMILLGIGAAVGALASNNARDGEVMVMVMAGFMLVGAVLFIPLALIFWPIQWLLIDTRIKFVDTFGLAARITNGNRLTTFVLFLASMGVSLLGLAACGFGLLFAYPLVFMFWNVAYLMMSGQIGRQPGYPQTYQQPMYR